ncbi:uncharacterized protein LOC117559977 isoform X2 [Gymnodraco acuticeps]|nr:uncharacterized protein LOC117559977 isoform X2 [Gymnodraco acuticeps]
MAGLRRRKPPLKDAIEHASEAVDKTAKLEVMYINSFKGRGVFATSHFQKGDFVVEYRGELIHSEESQKRRRIYHVSCAVFMFDFYWQERTWCVDAAQEDSSLGRLVNDDHKHPNCKMKKVMAENKPHLCLFALRDINPGEEIIYDYGGTDWPWRKQVGEPATAIESSEAEIPSTSEPAPQRSSISDTQVGEPATAIESSEAEIPSTSEPAPQRSSISDTQVGEPATAIESSEAEIPSTSEPAPQRSSISDTQVGEPATAIESSEAEIPSTSEPAPQRSSISDTQVGEPATAIESSEAEIPSTSEPAPQRSSISDTQVGEPATAIESSEAEIPSTSEPAPQRSSISDTQVGEPATAIESSEAEIPSTSEPAPQRSSISDTQVGEPATAIESSEAEIPSTSEPAPQRSSISDTQHLGETESYLLKKKYGMMVSLVNYTDSDESQSPSRIAIHDDSSQAWSPGTDIELKEDKDIFPMLRRTKSIQMTSQIEFDSDELFDPSSADSGEEYIPKTSEDSSGTDTSEVIDIVHKKDSMLGRQYFQKLSHISDECLLPTQVNSSSSQQVPKRGRSPSRRDSNSIIKRKRQCLGSGSCPTTRTIGGKSLKQSIVGDTGSVSENSTHEVEPNLPDGASSLLTENKVAEGSRSPCIPAVCKKEDGSRMYNKKQYCLYCKIGVGKIARHLERAHHNKPDVAQALSFPKGSKERRMHLEHLRNRGNFAHNVEVLNAGVGNLVSRKQPKQDSQAQNFLHCVYCQGLFNKKLLWRHMKICKFKPDVPQKPGKTRAQALSAFAVPPPPGVKIEFWKLLNNMVQDDVYIAVKSDVCIMEYGEHLYNRLGYDVGKHEYIRQKLRELGRLLVCSRKTTPLKTIQDHVKPINFLYVVQAVKHVAGFDSETNTYKCPSLALKIGHSLKKMSMLVESRANVQSNYSAAKDARTFRRVYETRWNELISAASLRTLQESKWNAPQLLPFTKDVQTLHSYLDVQQQEVHIKLSADKSPQTWSQLAKVTLTQVILFNRRRAGEVSKMPLSAYLSQNPSHPQEDVNIALSELEKKLCKYFRRIEIRGKRGRKVPVLLTPAMQQALDLLVGTRQECGVPKENIYLFARPSAFTCYRGSDCLRYFAKACGAKNPESLTSTKLRKQTGTLSQVLNLTNTELDLLADFLGHDIRVHRQFYRLPEGTLQLAKISKLLMALEQGRLAEFQGKTLDDISIDPEENVHMDSDNETACESDSQEGQVTSTQMENKTSMRDGSNTDEASQQGPMTPPPAAQPQTERRQKGRQPFKKKLWEKTEIQAVEKHLMSFINTCRVPRKSDCDKCLKMEGEALKQRNWLAIKFYIKNRITALKSKM